MWLAKPSSRVIFSAQCDDGNASWSLCVLLVPHCGRCFSTSRLACSSRRSEDVPRAGAWTSGKSPCHWIEHTRLRWGMGSCQLPQRRAGLKECLTSCWGKGCPARISQPTPAGTSFLIPTLVSEKTQKEIWVLCHLKVEQDRSAAAENCRYTCAELIFKHWNPSPVPFSEWCLDEQCFGSTWSLSSSWSLLVSNHRKTFSERPSLPPETEVWVCACVWMPLRRQNLS